MLTKRYTSLYISLFLLLSLCDVTKAQSTYNPLSIYGIGEIELNEYGNTAGMGGVVIGMRTQEFLNNTNPASLTALDTNTFIYNMAVSSRFSSFKSGNIKESATNSNIKKIAVGFVPLKGWAISAGMQPFSSTGYQIVSKQAVEGTNGSQILVKYTGNGGLNKLYIANGIKIFPGFSVGVNTFCVLGSVNTSEETQGWLIQKTSSANKVSWDFGMQYAFRSKNNMAFTIGANYGLSYNIVLDNTLKVTDEENNVLEEGSAKSQTQKIPQFYGIGASVNYDGMLTLAADYSYLQWSSLKSNFSNIHFTDVNKIRIGAEYIRTNNSYASLLQRLRYQGGFTFGNSYLMFGQKQNYNYSASLGLGIPVKGSLLAYISYEYGNTGLSGNLGKVRENYSLFNISFSIKDFWFLKRKYD